MKLFKRISLYHFVVLGAFVVFVCNMIISYYHAWEMYSSIGDFPGRLAHVAVVAFDTVFALATLVISIGTLKKIDLGRRVWVAFVFGFFITTWSNIRASMGTEWHFFVTLQWKKISVTGWESLAAGLSTPAALVAIELLLSWMVTNREKFISTISGKTVSETGGTNTNTINKSTSNVNTSFATSDTNTSCDTRNENTSGAFTSFDTSKVSTRKDNTSYSRTSDLNTSVSFTNYGTSYVHTSNDDTSEMDTSLGNSAFTSEANTSNVGTNETNASEDGTSDEANDSNTSTTNTSEEDTRNHDTSESNTSNVTSEIGTSEDGTNEIDTSDTNTSEVVTSNKPSNVVELAKHTSKSNKKRTSRRTTWTEEDYQRVREIALQLREQDPKKELPGRPTLKEKAGCKENLARKVLEDLKEEMKQSS